MNHDNERTYISCGSHQYGICVYTLLGYYTKHHGLPAEQGISYKSFCFCYETVMASGMSLPAAVPELVVPPQMLISLVTD